MTHAKQKQHIHVIKTQLGDSIHGRVHWQVGRMRYLRRVCIIEVLKMMQRDVDVDEHTTFNHCCAPSEKALDKDSRTMSVLAYSLQNTSNPDLAIFACKSHTIFFLYQIYC